MLKQPDTAAGCFGGDACPRSRFLFECGRFQKVEIHRNGNLQECRLYIVKRALFHDDDKIRIALRPGNSRSIRAEQIDGLYIGAVYFQLPDGCFEFVNYRLGIQKTTDGKNRIFAVLRGLLFLRPHQCNTL